jgi:tetratricopeptide (TPR) repeat protein
MSEHLRQAPTLLELIEHSRDALNTCHGTDSRRTSLHLDLAILLWRLHKRTGLDDALEEMFHVARDHIAFRHPEPDRALCYSNLAILLTERYEHSSEVALIDQAVELQRAALVLRPVGHPDRAEFCGNLAIILSTRYSQSGDVSLLDDAITMEWEVLDLSPIGHPNRALACGNLAVSLHMRYDQTGDIALLHKMIILAREALDLCPVGDPDRAMSCNNLAGLLTAQYEKTGGAALLHEAIELEREALCLRPVGDPDRSRSCGNLATSLIALSKQTGEVALIDEAIRLHREALDLQPAGHSNYATCCSDLARSLNQRYQQTMDATLLEEAIVLGREALDLRSEGHPKRAESCINLAASLIMRYAQTNNVTLLDEAIALEREVCSLHPPGHSDRATSYDHLAKSLIARYSQTVNVALLDEAIELQSEALDLRLVGDPDRAASCSNLAISLSTRYKLKGDISLLEKAIDLEHTAVSLRPAGHPHRSYSCGNLAAFLVLRYEITEDVALLDQAIQLEREAVELRSADHPDRLASSNNLAVSLCRRYDLTRDVALISEAIELQEEVLQKYRDRDLPGDAWRSLTILFSLHLLPDTPHFSIQQAMGYLHHAFKLPVDNLHDFMPIISGAIRSLWRFQHMWTPNITDSLLDIYKDLIDRWPMMAGFLLDAMSLFQSLESSSQLGSDACVAAIQAGQHSKAIELLDHAHGIIWAQSLHQRDPQLKDAPPELASELEHLLRATAMPASATDSEPHNPHLTPNDVRHQQNSRIRTILGEIRAMPGLERFMLGSTFEILREVAREHPVVVLVSGHGHVFALIISPSSKEGPDALRLELTQDDLQSIAQSAGKVHLRHHATAQEVSIDASTRRQNFFLEDRYDSNRAMRPGNFGSNQGLLATLWSTVVKPVLTHLGIEVWHARVRRTCFALTCVLTESRESESPAKTSLVHRRRLCITTDSCSWYLYRSQSGVLL